MPWNELWPRLRLLERQGLLRGDLNLVQQLALQLVILLEDRNMSKRELERMKITVMAGDRELYKALFPAKEEVDEEGVNWIQPGTEEYDELLRDLGASRSVELTLPSRAAGEG